MPCTNDSGCGNNDEFSIIGFSTFAENRTESVLNSVLLYLRDNKPLPIQSLCSELCEIVCASAHEYENLERMSMLVHFGILEELLQNFSEHNQDEGRAAMLRLLSMLTKHADLRFSIRKKKLNILSVVWKCLENENCSDVAKFGYKTLRNLLLDAAERKKFYSENGMERILLLMKLHRNSAAVQEQACDVIYVLAKSTARRKLIAQQCLEIVYDAARIHHAHSGVQHRANQALRCMTTNEEAIRATIFWGLCTATTTVLCILVFAILYAIPLL